MTNLAMTNNTTTTGARSGTWHTLSGFVMEKQQEKHYCIPACCQATVLYCTGGWISQGSIVDSLNSIANTTSYIGSTLEIARTFLNGINGMENYYVLKPASTTLNAMQICFYAAITTYLLKYSGERL